MERKILCIHIGPDFNDEESGMRIAGKYPKGLLEDFANLILRKWPGGIKCHFIEMSQHEANLFTREAETILQRARSGCAKNSDS